MNLRNDMNAEERKSFDGAVFVLVRDMFQKLEQETCNMFTGAPEELMSTLLNPLKNVQKFLDNELETLSIREMKLLNELPENLFSDMCNLSPEKIAEGLAKGGNITDLFRMKMMGAAVMSLDEGQLMTILLNERMNEHV